MSELELTFHERALLMVQREKAKAADEDRAARKTFVDAHRRSDEAMHRLQKLEYSLKYLSDHPHCKFNTPWERSLLPKELADTLPPLPPQEGAPRWAPPAPGAPAWAPPPKAGAT